MSIEDEEEQLRTSSRIVKNLINDAKESSRLYQSSDKRPDDLHEWTWISDWIRSRTFYQQEEIIAQGSIEKEMSLPHDEKMNAVSRDELDAKLEALRSDLRASNADLRSEFHAMRADVADIRTAINQDLSTVVSSMGDLKGAAGEVKGSLDGVKTSLTTVQWLVGALLAAAALYVAIVQLSAPAAAPPQAQQAPIIINVPAGTAPASPGAAPASR